MVPLISEGLRLARHLLRPENTCVPAETFHAAGARPQTAALAGIAKALLWALLAVLAGLGLGQLHG